MLRRALSEHESQQAASNASSSQDSFATAHSHSAALKPSPPAALNARSQQPPLVANSSLKRTSSGLAKVFASGPSNGFSDFSSAASHSLKRPAVQTMPVKTIQTRHETITIDEDDFDSDPELDVENPAGKAPSVKYPKLPSSSANPPPSSQALYPSLQRAQVHTATEVLRDPAPPRSSAPLPWSSSPPEHTKTPSGAWDLQAFKHEETPRSTRDSISRPEDDETGSSPVQRPTKRRHLPWAASQAQDLSTFGKAASDSTQSSRIDMTPANKGSVPALPWNTSASAIKNNQKELRKMNRSKQLKDEGQVPATVTGLKKQKGPQRVALSNEQQHVLDLVVNKSQSVFFTGSAGTGKSVLLREIIHVLRKKYSKEQDRVAVTASTGLAACNIGGVTLHSFAGIGLGKEDVPELVKKIKRNQKAKHRWMRTKVLVVDEVSMVDGELFDKLEAVARSIRNNGRPFGGIQVVITGDFFQLPPVPDGTKAARFCFDANTWDSAIDHTIGLHHVFRQKDPEFARMLNEMREGKLTKPSIDAFRALARAPQYDDGLSTTELFPTRAEVDNANAQRMRNLHGGDMRFDARDGGAITDKAQRDRLLQNCMAPEVLTLKKGAQVMLIKNIDENLVNGSLGTVRGFMNENMWDDYNTDPVEFGEIESADVNMLNPEQLKKRRAMQLSANTSQLFPLVRFQQADGCTRDLLCNRESWKIELPNGEVQASRAQVPLILAWALSIHKAQGQTLERVKVDLGKVFERGQAYVALSRATTMNGLQVLRFDPNKVQAHERVRGFYAGLSKFEAQSEDAEA